MNFELVIRQRMSKAELLNQIREHRARFDAALAKIPADQFDRTPIAGDWTARDIVSHVMCYERWTAAQVDPALRADLPVAPADVDLGDTEQRNQWYHTIEKDVPLAKTRERAARVYQQMVSAIESASEDHLNAPMAFIEGDNLDPTTWDAEPAPVLWPLWKWIADNSYDHYDQHSPTLEAWAGQSK